MLLTVCIPRDIEYGDLFANAWAVRRPEVLFIYGPSWHPGFRSWYPVKG
jgi:hypothetical protein